ncbi:hypothetical protein SNOG_05738 [Parastagonospora nodorum SN15]|uniref:Uncharacterized protein n=1 Tax=Phaeosphaeria nodorum (strain SN15 / ATCC MYA-4574 / FGSC 10173) TaxID=321614 RepID=Q0UR76_PHANO|nr:hypothetical protein SNOG_05738 [Parastagonospora nodorum SN15]EAT86802.1 hypothetical protein SNOG_05738 [Parastagonospora nodorum SN15]
MALKLDVDFTSQDMEKSHELITHAQCVHIQLARHIVNELSNVEASTPAQPPATAL